MSIFILHQHPEDSDGDRVMCLSDRFNWFAALLPPFWAVANGLWRVLGLMVMAVIAVMLLDNLLVAPILALYLIAVWWLGFEANHIHSKALAKKGWGEGINIIASDALMAEKDYFSRAPSGAEASGIIPGMATSGMAT